MSSLLEQLEKDFGVSDKVVTKTVDYRGHKYTLRRLDWQDIEKANSIIFRVEDSASAMDKANTEEAGVPDLSPMLLGLRTQFGFACVTVAAIDGQPVWKIFKLAKEEDIVKMGFDPLEPPAHIRYMCADRMATLFSANKKQPGLIKFIFNVYTEFLDVEDSEKTEEEKKAELGTEGNRPSTPS